LADRPGTDPGTPPMQPCPCGKVEDILLVYLCAKDCGNVVCVVCAKRHPIAWVVCPKCVNDGGD
jgi:hypothetical protein